ncbi:glycosyltransferase family 9 protein [Bdellovibrio sp. ArHS]|uniref:glycosyltransferase family 9 protein n=1 Tax=Bdellovibrio sp. ArHS TaxID=1569284 RepID=UPI0025B9843F|nr:glycosyltransferase family 9 protein [Bdellovibrio sp. ArHS]
MKILVIQLARLGDIYMSWPAMRALRRAHPKAEIHFLTRPRFEGAVEGLTAIDKHLSLPVSAILAPLIQEDADTEAALATLNESVDALRDEHYDWVINLTFSPVSSYLTHAVTGPTTTVTGYTRYSDGTLCLADEVSAYFYAQVGTDKPNRVHVVDVIASMLNLEYIEADFAAPQIENFATPLPETYLVVHVGASEKHKSLSPEEWAQLLKPVAATKIPVVLIGAAGEAALAEEIQAHAIENEFVNLVGLTKISDIFAILQDAELLIGCDSAPIHMASLTDTPTFNVSIGDVNYWETGPKSTLGFIYRVEKGHKVDANRVGECITGLLQGQVAPELITRAAGLVSYEKNEAASERFQWDLVQALYLGASYPLADRMEILQGATQLADINKFAMEQIALIPEKGLQNIGPFLDRSEEVIESISRMVPELSPLISWYQAEKVRVGPGTLEEICTAALDVHERLARHIHVYVPQEALLEQEEKVEEVCDGTL